MKHSIADSKFDTPENHIEFYLKQLAALEETLTIFSTQFMEICSKRLDRFMDMTDTSLKQLEKQAIEESITQFYHSQENARNNFHTILKEIVAP